MVRISLQATRVPNAELFAGCDNKNTCLGYYVDNGGAADEHRFFDECGDQRAECIDTLVNTE
jgi:hypothetical protein